MSLDAIIEHYKQHVDRTLLRETMKLTPQQRMERFEGFMADVVELHLAGQRHLKKSESRALHSETATPASE
jgi:hypothetical protein